MLLFHSHPRPLYSSRPGLLSRSIPRNPDCTQPSVRRNPSYSALQPSFSPSRPLFSFTSYSFVPRVRVFPRVAPYFSCFAAASRSTFIQYRYVLARRGGEEGGEGVLRGGERWGNSGTSERTIRADATYARHLKKSPRHWPRSRFHSTLCRRRVDRPRRARRDWPSVERNGTDWSRRAARSARSQRLYEASGR